LQDFGATGDASMQRLADSADQASAKLAASLTRWTYSLDPAARAQAQLSKGRRSHTPGVYKPFGGYK